MKTTILTLIASIYLFSTCEALRTGFILLAVLSGLMTIALYREAIR